VTCPACGKVLTPEFPFRLSGVPGFGELVLVPEAERVALSRGKLAAVETRGRVAVGFAELAEKLVIANAGLDDRVIEIMKYYLLTGSSRDTDAAGSADVSFIYHGREGERHVFHIVGMREGEVGVARLAQDLYARIARDLESRMEEEPFREFCTPPWVSLRRVSGGMS
jgi:hypothetical protein